MVKGEEFNVVVRRVSSRQVQSTPIREMRTAGARPRRRSAASAASLAHVIDLNVPPAGEPTPPATAAQNWRYVIGTFQVRIPVRTEEAILFAEEDALAIFKWRLQAMAPSNRWYPVLTRYVRYLAAKVDGLGGDSSSIAPSPTGVTRRPKPHEPELEFTGKVIAVRYDRFGDFIGLVLRLENGHERSFRAHEHEVEELVREAWFERFLITVVVARHADDWPVTLTLRRAPRH